MVPPPVTRVKRGKALPAEGTARTKGSKQKKPHGLVRTTRGRGGEGRKTGPVREKRGEGEGPFRDGVKGAIGPDFCGREVGDGGEGNEPARDDQRPVLCPRPSSRSGAGRGRCGRGRVTDTTEAAPVRGEESPHSPVCGQCGCVGPDCLVLTLINRCLAVRLLVSSQLLCP